MIILPLLALLVGFIIVFQLNLALPAGYADYLSLIVLASLDAIAGGARARLEGKFHDGVFITGVVFNSIAAVGLAYIGDRMGMSLYLAPVVALGVRIFYNAGRLRRLLLERSAAPSAPPNVSDLERFGC